MFDGFTPHVLLDRLAARGDDIAVAAITGDTMVSRTYRDLANGARAIASGLVAAGIKPEERIALFAPNSPDWVVARLAIAAAGAVGAAIDDVAGVADVEMVLTGGGCQRIFTSKAHLPLLRGLAAAGSLQTFVIDAGDGEELDGAIDWRALANSRIGTLPQVAPTAPAALVYTSGTTGKPKSFILTYQNLDANIRAIVQEELVGRGDRILLPLPLHHVYPFCIGLMVPLVSGATVVFPEAATGPSILHALRAARATAMVGVPRLYEALFAGVKAQAAARGPFVATLFRSLLSFSQWWRRRTGQRLGRLLFGSVHRRLAPQLRLLVSGGARLEGEETWALEGLGWEVLSGYGLAETASVFTANLPGRQRIGSEGKALGQGRVRIADADAAGIGEIQLSGPSVFAGYLDNAEANRASFTEDGWFRTGDLGWLDADGFLYVTGRSKELIVLSGGKNVQPEDLERIYGEGPMLKEIAVLERSGSLVALVVPNLEAIRASGTTSVEDAIRVALTSTGLALPTYQRLSGFAISREPLPRTRLGKYQRFLLPKLYDEVQAGRVRAAPAPLSAEDQALLERSPGREVWALLAARYCDKPLSLDASPQLDLGIDSLEWVAIGLELEAKLGVVLSEQDLTGIATVRDLLQAVEAASSGGPKPAVPTTGRPAATIDQVDWLAPTGPLTTATGVVLHALLRLVVKLMFRLSVTGRENLPTEDPFIIAANHVSDLDALALAASLPVSRLRKIYWSGDRARLFKTRWQRWFCRVSHIFPADERAPATTLDRAADVLARGNSLIWFPEGWRSPTGELQRFQPGIGVILDRAPVPVVPAFIQGTFEAMPRTSGFPRPHPVRVIFGRGVDPQWLDRVGDGDTKPARIVSALRQRIADLTGQQPRQSSS